VSVIACKNGLDGLAIHRPRSKNQLNLLGLDTELLQMLDHVHGTVYLSSSLTARDVTSHLQDIFQDFE